MRPKWVGSPKVDVDTGQLATGLLIFVPGSHGATSPSHGHLRTRASVLAMTEVDPGVTLVYSPAEAAEPTPEAVAVADCACNSTLA